MREQYMRSGEGEANWVLRDSSWILTHRWSYRIHIGVQRDRFRQFRGDFQISSTNFKGQGSRRVSHADGGQQIRSGSAASGK